jgi:tetratricopeptide (TPR) repeat protein
VRILKSRWTWLAASSLVVVAVWTIRPLSQSIEPNRLAVVLEGIGTYSRPITTTSVEAQKFFDQGLRLTFGYYFPEAIASFQEAQRYDPDHPMLGWGLALAAGPSPNSRFTGFADDPQGEARKAISAARGHSERASAVERALIETLTVRYDVDSYPDRAQRDGRYIEATRSLLDRFPNDLEAGFLRADALMTRAAWRYWRADGSPLPGTADAVSALERVMTIDPNHPGAVHLWVHLFESSAQPEKAMPQAERLESLMPKAGHIVHMPSHIFLRLGLNGQAVASNERSIAVDGQVLAQWGARPFPAIGTYPLSARTHRPHALDFLRFAATMQGNSARAIQAVRTGVTAVPAEQHHMGRGQHMLAAVWLVLKTFGKWNEILAEPLPSSGMPFVEGVAAYARGSAFVARRQYDSAQLELQRIETARTDPAIKELLAYGNPASSLLRMARVALEGEIALSRGRFADAARSFEEAVRLQDDLSYIEPPDWSISMRRHLGVALLRARRPREAERAFRQDLQEFRDNGWSLFGLWHSLAAQGRTAEANQTRERFERAWKDADVTLEAAVF